MSEFDVNEILKQNFPQSEVVSCVVAEFTDDCFIPYNELVPDIPARSGVFKYKKCIDDKDIVGQFYFYKYSFRDLVSRRMLEQDTIKNMAVHFHLIKEHLLNRFPGTYIKVNWCYDDGRFFKAREDSNAMEMQVKVSVVSNTKIGE